DICLNRRGVASDSVIEMLHLTPIPLALWRLAPEFAAKLLMSDSIWLPDVAEALSSIERSRPVFAFVHSMHPHDAIYESDCSLIPRLSEQVVAAHANDDRTAKKPSAYVSTIECLNAQLLELIDA